MQAGYSFFLVFIMLGIVGSICTLLSILYYFLREWRAGNLW